MIEQRDPELARSVERREVTQVELMERFAAHPFANLETYKYFNQKGETASHAKEEFIDMAMDGETPEAPEFEYPNLHVEELAARRDELTAMLEDVLRLDMSDETNRLLREKVTDRLHEVGIMLLARAQSELGPDHSLYAAVSYQLGENMREVYGKPEAGHWRGVLGYRLSLLAEIEDRSDAPAAVREAWEFVRDHLPSDLPIEHPYLPQPETIAWYRQEMETRLEPARTAVSDALASGDLRLNEDKKFDAGNIVTATRLALAARGIEGWNVELTDEANIDTSQERKTIFIPRTRLMSLSQFDAVIQAHEIDEHVARRDNGDKSGEPILGGTGCAGYLAWEEGNGKANEALLKGKASTRDSAFNYFLSGGLALGLDNEKRSWPEFWRDIRLGVANALRGCVSGRQTGRRGGGPA